MKLVLLGTGGYHPSDLRQTACMMLPSEGIILDAGTAMYRVRDWIQTDTLDILVSHAHLDHIIGLTYLFDVLYKKDVSRITTYTDTSNAEQIREHLFAEPLFPVQPPFEFASLEGMPMLGSGCRVTSFPLEHPGDCTGFRLDWKDRSLAYVTDTVADEGADYVSEIEGVDLLIHECYFHDKDEEYARLTGHSWSTAVGNVAAKAQVGRLALVHVNPVLNVEDPINLDLVREIFPDTVLGTDRMELEF